MVFMLMRTIQRRSVPKITNAISSITTQESVASRCWPLGRYWLTTNQMPAQIVITVISKPGTPVIQAYLPLFMRSNTVVPIKSVTEASSWLQIPKSGQMLEISPEYTR